VSNPENTLTKILEVVQRNERYSPNNIAASATNNDVVGGQ
jgi:uncharacterized protein YfkK (UPF0435 family)